MKIDENPKATAKGILIGGFIAGLLSITPIISLLNLIFLSLIFFGGYLAVSIITKNIGKINIKEAIICGILTAFISGGIWTFTVYKSIQQITPEQLEQTRVMLEKNSSFLNGKQYNVEDAWDMLKSSKKYIYSLLFFSIIMSTSGAVASRYFNNRRIDIKEEEKMFSKDE